MDILAEGRIIVIYLTVEEALQVSVDHGEDELVIPLPEGVDTITAIQQVNSAIVAAKQYAPFREEE